ncbi:topoisomerase-4 subunit A [Mycoplasmoides fastidiosum]|uniref:DNA topoisomerase (ATP-hydrolyzing) n=1 Tax=Mycoplasmoides fastidiosum TaxID=92758 RepID=A0ABU0LZU6_9BACT|nr:DNA topoisomerase (ATP-hydrolyzing) subunit A [Mycoplasmoides fastidiosum]MDQ0514231.1 topoisomerase-4 subunit A [Mycoplasmoides fastidiosum]UUD37362.1 DNA topoisomerase (ATP-hydrolyzing) subunit A [Mycoplasmoides fastidiosum]
MKNKKSATVAESMIERPLEEVISELYGRYAKYVIQERALPDLRDGLKPVQRRILYVAHLKNLTHKHPHKKSTNLVGEVMGNFHPHGDSSIYDAIVRMAQPWKSNLLLLEMHGNVGSIDGDPAAASRYTEIRLGAVSEWMLKNIDKKTVNFVNNFDDTKKEPTVLPAQFFNLLVNGSTGIAAGGYATTIPPFNPSELSKVLLKLIDEPNLSVNQILKILPAPDFPTKGTIEMGTGIKEAYETGRGKFFIHANYTVVEQAKIKQIVFSDIPFDTNKAVIVKEIDDLIWNNDLPNLIEVRDESDRNGLSIVIDVEKNADIPTIINFLYKKTRLRISYPINFVVIDNRKPKLMSMPSLLNSFLTHFKDVIRKAFEYDVNQIEMRIEILLGFIKALSITDEIITLIRRSSDKQDAKTKMQDRYGFSERQAEAIVQLRLYRLSAADVRTFKEEHQELEQNLARIKALLNDQEQFNYHLKSLILEFNKEFGLKRQTQLTEEVLNLEVNEEVLVADKPVFYTWTKNQELKIIDQKKIDFTDLKNNKIKANDFYRDLIEINNRDSLLIFSNTGNAYVLNVAKIDTKKLNALPTVISSYLKTDPHEQIIGIHPISYTWNLDHKMVLLTTKNGLTKKVLINQFLKNKSSRGLIAIKLSENDQLVDSLLINDNLGSVLFLTKNSMGSHVLINSINCLSRNSSGQRAMKLKPNDAIVGCLEVPANSNAELFLWFESGIKKISFNNKNDLNKLALQGFSLAKTKTTLERGFFLTEKDFLWIKTTDETIDLIPVSQFRKTALGTGVENQTFIDLWKETLFAQPLSFTQNEKETPIAKLF